MGSPRSAGVDGGGGDAAVDLGASGGVVAAAAVAGCGGC